MKKISGYTAPVIIAVSILLLLVGCTGQPAPSDEAVLAAASEREVPSIEILGSEWFERTIYGRYFPEIDIRILDGTLLAWNLNGRNLRRPRGDATRTFRPGREISYMTNPLRLAEGENELAIWARGSTGLIVERRFAIASDQTVPEEQRTAMPHLNDVTISYDPEFPTIVTVAFEFVGDYYGDALRASAVATCPVFHFTREVLREDVDVTNKGGGVFEVTVELLEEEDIPLNVAFGRTIDMTLKNEWNVSTQGSVGIAINYSGSDKPEISWISCSNRGNWMMG